MEYVSLLAGERFSDRPRCVHPALARLARLANDRIESPAARDRLALLAPDLTDTGVGFPWVDEIVAVTCLWAAARAGLADVAIARELAGRRHGGGLRQRGRRPSWVWRDASAGTGAALGLVWPRARRMPGRPGTGGWEPCWPRPSGRPGR